MQQTFITGFIILVSLTVFLPLLVLYMSRRKQDVHLAGFYKSCDFMRDAIHSCSSKAEGLELLDDIAHVRESYENLIPVSVLDKELGLLVTLLTKKSKKLK
jgi:hypothetical protein